MEDDRASDSTALRHRSSQILGIAPDRRFEDLIGRLDTQVEELGNIRERIKASNVNITKSTAMTKNIEWETHSLNMHMQTIERRLSTLNITTAQTDLSERLQTLTATCNKIEENLLVLAREPVAKDFSSEFDTLKSMLATVLSRQSSDDPSNAASSVENHVAQSQDAVPETIHTLISNLSSLTQSLARAETTNASLDSRLQAVDQKLDTFTQHLPRSSMAVDGAGLHDSVRRIEDMVNTLIAITTKTLAA